MDVIPAPAFELLLQHGPFVQALARELLSDPYLAEDVAQETWLRYLRSPPREREATRSWLRSVTRRLSVESLRGRARAQAREQRVARAEALPSAADELAQAEVLRSVVEAVLALDEPYRTSVLLRYWRGWEVRRIAQESGEPLATVQSRLQRAHARLRQRLDREHGRAAWGLALGPLAARELGPALVLGGGAKLAAGLLVAAGALGLAFFQPWRAVVRPPDGPVAPVPPQAAAVQAAELQEGPSSAPEPARAEVATTQTTGTLRLRGTVTDRAWPELGLGERPAAGLELRFLLAPERFTFEQLGSARVRTDEAGRFELELADPGRRPLFLRIHSPADADYRAINGGEELTLPETELTLQRFAHGILAGTVIDEQGRPLAGVRIDLRSTSASVKTVSDAEGRFSAARLQAFQRVEAQLAGHSLLDWAGGEPREEGGWEPLVVRLGPEAALELALLDARRNGIAGAEVAVELDPSENSALGVESGVFERVPARRTRTDGAGRARLEGLWAGRKLRVSIQLEGESFQGTGVRGAELFLCGDPTRGQPLVLAPGELLELEARLEVERELAGHVRHEDGAPVAGARVEVRDTGRGTSAWEWPVLLVLEADRGGVFAGRIRTSELVGPLQVVARDPGEPRHAPDGLAALGYVGGGGDGSLPGAELTLDPADAEALRALELVLEPRLSIAGVLRGRDGQPVAGQWGLGGHRLWAVRAGSTRHLEGVAGSGTRQPGGFVIEGLRPGSYDLFLSEELEGFYSFENFLHRFPGIAAGAQGVELRLPEREEVRIQVRFAGTAPSQGIVLHRRFFPERPAEFSAPQAQRKLVVCGARGWPAGTTYDFSGIGGHDGELGRSSDGYDGLTGPEHALQPLGPGWYAIGVHVEGCFPQATPLFHFEPGSYTIEFELLPAATLRGRLLADATAEFLAVALVDDAGQPIPLGVVAGYGKPVTCADTGARGDFVLHHAPTGRFRLRAGSRAELEQGLFRRELELELRPGENPPVELGF